MRIFIYLHHWALDIQQIAEPAFVYDYNGNTLEYFSIGSSDPSIVGDMAALTIVGWL